MQDAVLACRALDIQYLWIDALCILQDDIDDHDWYEESGKMCDIYSNAQLTIAADVSEKCGDGFIGKQRNKKLRYSFFPTHKGVLDTDAIFLEECQVGVSEAHSEQDPTGTLSSPLSKRGWALQEGILPNRLLHFTGRHIVWECKSRCVCDCGIGGKDNLLNIMNLMSNTLQNIPTRPKAFLNPDPVEGRHVYDLTRQSIADSVFRTWQILVNVYTQRELTKPRDKLSALSGLASIVVKTLHIDSGAYLAGLWKDDLAKGLLWYVGRSRIEPRRSLQYRAPSWSWASLDGPVQYFAEHYQFVFHQDIEILEAKCTSSPLDPTGRVKAGHILLRGSLVPVKLEVEDRRDGRSYYTGKPGDAGIAHPGQIVEVRRRYSAKSYEVLYDERKPVDHDSPTSDFSSQRMEHEAEYYCLEIGTTRDVRLRVDIIDDDRAGARLWWLVLKRCSLSDCNAHERVGLGYTSLHYFEGKFWWPELFHGAQREVIKLI